MTNPAARNQKEEEELLPLSTLYADIDRQMSVNILRSYKRCAKRKREKPIQQLLINYES